MENKYYTPSIEDFHVGFEYETNYLQDYDNWVEDVITQEDAGYFFDSYITDSSPLEFRVKYLDKEDIESLGFKFIKNHAGTTQSDFEKENIFLDCDFDFKGKLWLRIYDGEYDNEFNYFSGFIKNKSELKILLKQLNVI